MLTITENAVQHLQSLLAEQAGATGKGLRIYVEAGGCAGMQYGMTIDHRKEGDTAIERDGVSVLIDEFSAKYLGGATIDYADDLAGAGFRIQNPNAARSCGCGTSFETETQGAHQHTH